MANLKFEQINGEAVSTLDGGINDSVTSLDVDSATDFPSDGNFRILIGSEIMKVEAVSSNTFTVVRGTEGTTAASHSDGDTVTLIITAESLKRYVADYVVYGNAEDPPVINSLTDSNGNTLTSADFDWENQGGSTVTDLEQGGILLTVPIATSGPQLRGMSKTVPGSTPYSIIAGFQPENWGNEGGSGNFPNIGLGFHAIANDRNLNIFAANYNNFTVARYTDHTTFTSNDFSDFWQNDMSQTWLRIQDDGSRSRFAISVDGVDWQEVYDVSRTSHFLGSPPGAAWFLTNFILSATTKTSDGNYRLILNHWSET